MEPGEPGIWLVALRYDNADTSALREMADAVVPERLRRRPGASEARYRAHLAGRAAAATAFGRMGLKVQIVPDKEFGYLSVLDTEENPNGYYVNISHTEEIAVAAVSSFPVGVDVESTKRDASRVLPRVASDTELSSIQTTESEEIKGLDRPSIAVWSAKEAVSKATGLGIIFGMHGFKIDFSGKPPYVVRLEQEGPLKFKKAAVTFLREEDFLISVCSEVEALSSPIDFTRAHY